MWDKYFVSGISGATKPQAVPTDLRHDVARGIMHFATAATPVTAGILHDADDEDLQPAAMDATVDEPQTTSDSAGDDHDDDDGFTPPQSPLADRPWTRRLRGHRTRILSTAEREFLHLGLARHPGVYGDLPMAMVPRAAAMKSASPGTTAIIPKLAEHTLRAPDRDFWMPPRLKEVLGLRAFLGSSTVVRNTCRCFSRARAVIVHYQDDRRSQIKIRRPRRSHAGECSLHHQHAVHGSHRDGTHAGGRLEAVYH